MENQQTAPARTPGHHAKAIKKMVALVNKLLDDESTILGSYDRDRLRNIARVGNDALAKAEGR